MVHPLIGTNSPLDRLKQRQRVHLRETVEITATDAEPLAGLTRNDRDIIEQLMQEPMDYIRSEAFEDPDAERQIYALAPEIRRPDVSWYRPLMDDLNAASRRNETVKPHSSVLLTGAEERVLFLQYNYARFRIAELQGEIGNHQPTMAQARELLRWYRISRRYREQIAETNLALVLAMAKRTRMSEVDFADLISEGNMALLRSVDKFDADRGFKFSTYACRAILKAFSRQGVKLSKYRQRFPTDFDPSLEKSDHLDTLRHEDELEAAREIRHIVTNNFASLTDVEQQVIEYRFGLESGDDYTPLTLEQVGQIIGVTKERVRQIQNKAMEKVRITLEETRSDADRLINAENESGVSRN